MKEISSLKENIYRHRAYRKLEKVSTLKVFVEMFIAVILFDLLILLFHPRITYYINKAAAYILSPFYHNVKIISDHFLFGEVHLLDVSGRFPSNEFSISVAIVSAIIILILLFQRLIAKPYTIWMIFTFSIIFISSLFFIFLSKYFPYSMRIFLDLYMKTVICIWLIIPWIVISAFAPLPIKYPFKLSFIFFLLIYSIVFAASRYIVFVFILRKFSFIFMAVLYFTFGPFVDFIYIVGFYSYVMSKLSKMINENAGDWKWLF